MCNECVMEGFKKFPLAEMSKLQATMWLKEPLSFIMYFVALGDIAVHAAKSLLLEEPPF